MRVPPITTCTSVGVLLAVLLMAPNVEANPNHGPTLYTKLIISFMLVGTGFLIGLMIHSLQDKSDGPPPK